MHRQSANGRRLEAWPSIRIDWRIATTLASIAAIVFAVLAMPIAPNRGLRTQLQPQIFTWGLWLLFTPLIFAVARRAHMAGLAHWRGIAIHLVAGPFIVLLHTIGVGLLRWGITLQGATSVRFAVAAMVSFGYAGGLLRYTMIAAAYHALVYQAAARRSAFNEAQMAATLARTRLEALEARLHPHFLFNTLNTVTSLIRTNQDEAIRVVENLGELLRTSLAAEPGREVQLARELELVQRYVDIQHARFGDRVRVTIRPSPDTVDARVPQLILQPIVENAIRHGLAPREGPGKLSVVSDRVGESLRLIVRDDGVGFGRVNTNGRSRVSGAGIGLNNTIARLNELYGDKASLNIEAAEPTGTVVTIQLPFHTTPFPTAQPNGNAE